jgi:TonB-linked SusC/RagA family outer membrane protein
MKKHFKTKIKTRLIGLMLLMLFTTLTALAQSANVSGTVKDETGESIPGATVVVKGTQTGTVTDLDGNFSIQAAAGDILVVSFVGFKTKEVAVVGGQTNYNVTLDSSTSDLSEVVVVGYGTQSTRTVSSSVESVSFEDLTKAPVSQIGQMLQGKILGVRVNQTTGRPGEGMRFQIRGSASISAGSEPLYVIDGMPISGGLNNLNPSEIETISVLKDAAATSLYGSRGANGVVLIQTKSARSGKMQIEFDSFIGFDRVPENRNLKMMDAVQYAQFQKENAELNKRPVNPMFQDPASYAGSGTNWMDEISRIGSIQSYNLILRGGSEKFSSAVTAGYFNQEGVIVGTGYERYSLRFNTGFQASDKLKISFNLAPTYATNTNFSSDGNPYGAGGGNIVSSALISTPLVGPYDEDGNLSLTARDPASFGNPNWLRVAKDRVYEDENLSILSNSIIEYEIIKGLKAKVSANIEFNENKILQFNPSTAGRLFLPPPVIPFGSERNSNLRNWLIENTLDYNKEVNGHKFDVLIGFTSQKSRFESIFINASNYPDDKIQAVSAASQIAVTNDVQEWSLLSYLARVNYNYKNKYLLSAAIRRDGSSRFGTQNRWGNFPSVSLGWVVSEEDFWNIEAISFFKIRSSYGVVGNFNIGNYSFRSSLTPSNYVFGNSFRQGRGVNNIGDPALGWERNKQFNIGADLTLFNDKVQITYNYYTRVSTDLLYNVDIPLSSGFNSLQTNVGELKFWGHEIGINTFLINNSKFSWNSNFNISFDRNETVSLSTAGGVFFHGLSSYGFFSHRTQVGRPLGQFYGAIQDGVYINQQDFDSSPKHSSSQVGTIKFKDLNGDGVITFPEDYTEIGNPWPKYTLGFTNDFTFSNFNLSIVLVGSYGNQILSHYDNWVTNLDGVFNVLEEVKDRWKSPEDPGKGLYGSTQAGTTFLERDRWHSRFIRDGSYISVRTISLSYNFPMENNKFINNLRVYSSVQNAFLFTNYPGTNPEVNTRNSGSGINPGVDENSYPVPRTISIGLNVTF